MSIMKQILELNEEFEKLEDEIIETLAANKDYIFIAELDIRLDEIKHDIKKLYKSICKKCKGYGELYNNYDEFLNICPECEGSGEKP